MTDEEHLGLIELIGFPLDHAANRLGQLTLQIRNSLRQKPAVFVLKDHAAVAQVTKQVNHEQGIALGSGVQQLQVRHVQAARPLVLEKRTRLLRVKSQRRGIDLQQQIVGTQRREWKRRLSTI